MEQKTLGDVIDFVESVQLRKALFGSVSGFAVAFQQRVEKVGQAICREQNVQFGFNHNLPNDTPLGEESSNAFQELLDWYAHFR